MESKPAIVVIAYNRVKSIDRLLKSINNADIDSADLIISIDKSNTDAVEKYADSFEWKYGNKRIIKHTENLGLRKHILSVGSLLKEYESIIVLEDDIIVAPGFYRYATAAASFYSEEENIAGISLYNYEFNYQTFQPFNALKNEYDVYFMQIAMSWGQVWMRKSWNRFYEWYEQNKHLQLSNINDKYSFKDWDEKSWLKYHIGYCIANNKYFVYPYHSYTSNCSDQGIHVKSDLFVYHPTLKYCSAEKDFHFVSFANGIIYDSYNENKLLFEKLNLSSSELTLDLADNEKNIFMRKYLLTTKHLDKKIIKKYALEFRPIEMNVLMDNKGEGIYLYDTTIDENNRFAMTNTFIISYKYRIHSLLAILNRIGIKELLNLLLTRIIRK